MNIVLGLTAAAMPFLFCGIMALTPPPAKSPAVQLIEKLAALREYPEAGSDLESDSDAVAVLNWAIEKARNVNH